MGGFNVNGLFGRDNLRGLTSGHVDGSSNRSCEHGDLRLFAVSTGRRIRINIFDGSLLSKDFVKVGRDNKDENDHNGCSNHRLN